VRLWDSASGRALLVLRGHEKEVTAVAFHPDGSRLASSSRDATIRIWIVASGTEEKVLRGHAQPIGTVAWSPDGTRLASGSYARSNDRPIYGVIRLWDAATGASAREIASDQYAPITTLRFSPDGGRLLAGSWDQSVKLYDLESGKEPIVSTLAPAVGYRAVNAVAWSPDGTRLASGGKDGLVRLWDGKAASENAKLEGHDNWVWSVAWSPAGDRIASASVDQTIRLWDARTRAPGPLLVGHRASVRSVAWSPDGRGLASASEDGTVKLWDLPAIERRGSSAISRKRHRSAEGERLHGSSLPHTR
jgi:WD40 repeat protein